MLRRRFHFIPAMICLLISVAGVALRADQTESNRQNVMDPLNSYFSRYCIDCHGADEQMAGIAVHRTGSQHELLKQRKSWQRVLKMVRLGAMPPEDTTPRPTTNENKVVADILEDLLFDFDCRQLARPGHPTIRRLNRVEYNNTIRDLFGVDVTPADDFPSDDVGEGFDNIGDVLSISPLLIEKYLTAAEQVTDAVIDTTDYSIPQEWSTPSDSLEASHDDVEDFQGLRYLNRTGNLAFRQQVPVKARYKVVFDAVTLPLNEQDIEFTFKVDDVETKVFRLKQRASPKKLRHEFTLTAGVHRFVFELNDGDSEEDESKRPRLGIGRVVIHGPVGDAEPEYTETHRRIVGGGPVDDITVSDAATQVVSPLLYQVLRRPVTDTEIKRYTDLTSSVFRRNGMTWEQAVAATVQAMLVSPEFLFRVEQDPRDGESERLLNDYELATRLSYFLWSSMPDTELFQVAEQGRLHEPEILISQVHRMLRDEKSESVANNFAAQWLNLGILERSRPDDQIFSDFDEDLRQAMFKETSLVFRSIMQQDLNVEKLLTGRFTFVNGRLATHYGIEGITGDQFVRVDLDNSHRRGILTHASVLTLTSYPRRTSPVQRGKWILENILGDAPPPPPPNIPELEEAASKSTTLSIREQMAVHRSNPTCASCHQIMDPLGLGLENFDGIGRWRGEEHGQPVDASGELPGGRKFSGPQELVEILLSRRDDFVRTLTKKMLIYAIGRGLDYYDKCVIDDCVHYMQNHDNRFSSLVEAIVLSDAFMKRGHPEK
ncbi:MAG: DUF1592 domain-containing protein [Fuerstiella sp.]|nr:DUF1592 domain-containing protein [Fuerstiella sp.]